MLAFAHPHQRHRDSRRGPGELDGALRIAGKSREQLLHRVRHVGEDAGLEQRGAGDYGNPQTGGGLQHVLRAIQIGLHHPQVEGQLDEAEMVAGAALFGGDLGEARQAERVLLAEALPGGGAVPANPALVHLAFELGEGATDAVFKLRRRPEAELGFGVVQVEDVDGVHAQIGAAAVDLVGQKPGREGVHAAHHVAGRERIGDGAGGQKSGFGADDNFIALEAPEGRADAAFGSLVAVVDGAIEEVDAVFTGGDQGVGIGPVGASSASPR